MVGKLKKTFSFNFVLFRKSKIEAKTCLKILITPRDSYS